MLEKLVDSCRNFIGESKHYSNVFKFSLVAGMTAGFSVPYFKLFDNQLGDSSILVTSVTIGSLTVGGGIGLLDKYLSGNNNSYQTSYCFGLSGYYCGSFVIPLFADIAVDGVNSLINYL